MHIIVADDEILARETLVGILQDVHSSLHITEARSGHELVDLARQLKPDMAFVDIRMPGKNGLEAIKEALPYTPDTQWVMITGFAEFEYARQALQLGAVGYLLKPLDPDEVELLITRAAIKADQDCQSQCREFEARMAAMLHGNNTHIKDTSVTMPRSESWLGMIIYQDSPVSDPAPPHDSQDLPLYPVIREIMAEHCTKDLMLALVRLGSVDGTGHAIIGNALSADGKHRMLHVLQLIRQQTNLYTSTHARFTLLECRHDNSINAFQDEVNQLSALAFLRCVIGNDRIWTFDELQAYETQLVYARIAKVAVKVVEVYHSGDYVKFMNYCEKLYSAWHENESSIPPGMEDNLLQFLECSLDMELLSGVERKSWIEELSQTAGPVLLSKRVAGEPTKQDLIEAVIDYIEENYSGDITVAGIADRFQISPNHLSTLFRKKMGVTFIQYLTRLRMLRAQELLSRPEMKVNTAAEQVGYYSTRHFTNLFKEYVGCYPSEFSKKHTN